MWTLYETVKFELDCGETVFLKELRIEATYSGFTMGNRLSMSAYVKSQLAIRTKPPFDWLTSTVIDPPGHQLNLDRCEVCDRPTQNVVMKSFDVDGGRTESIRFLACAEHQIDDKVLSQLHESLLAKGMFRLLPRWLCYGEFNSFTADCEMNLLICWFVDSIDLHLRDLIGDNIRHVDWKGLAKFNDFGGW